MIDDKFTHTSPASAPANKPAAAKAAYWRSFPVFESLLDQEQPVLLDRVKTTCRQLDSILKQGSAHERSRAQKALTAYVRTLELYQELVKSRNEILLQTRNRPASPHDK
jgi:hypothetical protein